MKYILYLMDFEDRKLKYNFLTNGDYKAIFYKLN